MIGSFNYHKLEIPVEVITSNGSCSLTGTWTAPGHYAGAIRQDTNIKKVFFVAPTNSSEELLYDFNMAVGDTVKGYLSEYNPSLFTVDSIDSVMVGNDYRKRWHIVPCFEIYLIEGIGSTFGLIERLGCNPDQDRYDLTCFKQNSSILFPANATNCELITHVDNTTIKRNELIVSPNPFHTTAAVHINSEMEKGDLKIYNLMGLLVREENLVNQKTHLLIRAELPNGIYFLQITNNKGQSVTRKIIIE